MGLPQRQASRNNFPTAVCVGFEEEQINLHVLNL